MNVVRRVTSGRRSRMLARSSLIAGPRARPLHALQHGVGERAAAAGRCTCRPSRTRRWPRSRRPRLSLDTSRAGESTTMPVDAINSRRRRGRAPRSLRSMPKNVVSWEISRSSLTPRDGQLPCFPHDGVDGAASIVAAHLRDDAERALVVAALGNLHVRVVAWCASRRGVSAS